MFVMWIVMVIILRRIHMSKLMKIVHFKHMFILFQLNSKRVLKRNR